MRTIPLSDTVRIPILGFGVYDIPDSAQCVQTVKDALAAGYRSIDTAAIYMNEPAVGQAIAESGVPRGEIFLTTKIWCQDDTYEKAKAAIDAALRRLRTDYVDLLMIHEPMGDIYAQWRAMEDAYRAGKVRALGMSNMFPDRLMDFLMHADVKPVINQVRTNPYWQQKEANRFMRENGVVHEAHSPFSQGSGEILSDPVLTEIAQAHGRNVGQIILHWLMQRDIVTLTRSTKAKRMAENLDIFDFELTAEEMERIAALDRADGNAFDQRDPENVKTILSWKYHYDE